MNVPFEKYSSHGNHFVLVDETDGAQVADAHKPQFVRRCADMPGGIGADSVLFLAPAPRRAGALPSFAARFFEPNGDEFMTCGNGLASIAHHLHRCHGVDEAAVLVELPSRRPRWCRVGRDGGDWRVELRPSGVRLRRFAPTTVASGGAALVLPVDTALFAPVLRDAAGAALVYTGEPHCVVFDPVDASAPETSPGDASERESLLVERIGRHANRALRAHFPFGINVDLAWCHGAGDSLDYTCYERGIERETLACGTGALAVALAARHLGLAAGEVLRLLPRRARRHPRFAAAQLQVRFGARSLCTLTTQAEHVFTGVLTAECCT